jgi:hypothetical protein
MPLLSAGLEITEDLPEFYSNTAQILSSQWDFAFVFGSSRFATNDAGEIEVLPRGDVVVRLSPPHAKALSGKLARLVADYEKLYGPIAPLAPGLEDEPIAQSVVPPTPPKARRARAAS